MNLYHNLRSKSLCTICSYMHNVSYPVTGHVPCENEHRPQLSNIRALIHTVEDGLVSNLLRLILSCSLYSTSHMAAGRPRHIGNAVVMCGKQAPAKQAYPNQLSHARQACPFCMHCLQDHLSLEQPQASWPPIT